MKLISKLTDDGSQKLTLTGDDGISITFSLEYLPTQQSWKFDVESGDYSAKGMALVSSPNVMRNARKQVNFGLMVKTTDGLDPYYINDFKTGRVKVYLLSKADVDAVEANIFA